MTAADHPRHRLDDLLTHAVRFSVAAALAGVRSAEFALVRDSVEVSDSVLSKQVALLEQAGLVEVTKKRVGRRVRTWLALTDAGRATLAQHVAALQAIAAGTGAPTAQEAGAQDRPPVSRPLPATRTIVDLRRGRGSSPNSAVPGGGP